MLFVLENDYYTNNNIIGFIHYIFQIKGVLTDYNVIFGDVRKKWNHPERAAQSRHTCIFIKLR